MPAHALPRPAPRLLGAIAVLTVTPLACTPYVQSSCAGITPPSSTVGAGELQASKAPRLLEALRRVRPRFLQTRAPRRDQFAVVYVDGVRVGDLSYLSSVLVADVVDVAFLRAPDATTRFGTDHTGGALLVRTHGHGTESKQTEVSRCSP